MVKASLVDRRAVERLLLLVGALRSGVVDALADGAARSAGQVAASAGTDKRATRIVLEALAAEGVLEWLQRDTGDRPGESGSGAEDGTLYQLSSLGRTHLVDEGPELERSGLLHQANKVRGWLELTEVIRTGVPASKGTGPSDVRSRSLAMGERDPLLVDEIVERCLAYSEPIRTMVDVGGAVGHVARSFARRGVRATLFDKDEVIPLAKEFLGEEAGGLDYMAGDYTESLPRGPFDLAYFGNVYHIYGPDTNARVTQDSYSSVSPGGSIAIQDYVWGRSPEAAMFAVNMLRSTTDGGVWSEGQYRRWLGDAGFVDIEVIDLDAASTQLVLGRRPHDLERE